MTHIFLDTDVLLDFFLGRPPYAAYTSALFDIAEEKEVTLYVSSLSIANIYYFLRKGLGHREALKILSLFINKIQTLAVNDAVIRSAFSSNFGDFEDAIQHACAKTAKEIQFIVTRNTKDYKKSDLSVLTPAEALTFINS